MRLTRLRVRGPKRAHGVSLAGDVIFRELSVNPLFSFFHAIATRPLARTAAPPLRLHPAVPFDPVRGTLSGILSGVPDIRCRRLRRRSKPPTNWFCPVRIVLAA